MVKQSGQQVTQGFKLLPLVGAMRTAIRAEHTGHAHTLLPLVGAMRTRRGVFVGARPGLVATPRRGDEDLALGRGPTLIWWLLPLVGAMRTA